ncbi:MAG: hypothetical protein ACLGGX_07645 [Bdellovibrionia bacterium]
MKIIWLYLIVLLSGTQSLAATSGKLTGLTGMINIVSQQYGEGPDTDALVLFEDMNVPVQDSFLGPGKSIVSKDRALNFVCAERGARGGPTCTIMINRSANSILSRGRIGFRVTGDQAWEFSSKFKLDGNKVFSFISIDEVFRVYASEKEFFVLWDENGVR